MLLREKFSAPTFGHPEKERSSGKFRRSKARSLLHRERTKFATQATSSTKASSITWNESCNGQLVNLAHATDLKKNEGLLCKPAPWGDRIEQRLPRAPRS